MKDTMVIGVDFGTLSARALLVRARDGLIVEEEKFIYPHGVMDQTLPCGTLLGMDWALQHPDDYKQALVHTVSTVMRKSGVEKEQVKGIGIDFTGSTVMAVDEKVLPLCKKEEFKNRPHAYVKLWKHHGAHREAEDFTRAAEETDQELLLANGGRISPECFFPKILQTLREDMQVYQAANLFIEAGDWLVWQMTGNLTRSMSAASLKAFYRKERGYPAAEFFHRADHRIKNIVEEKVKGDLVPLGGCAGQLREEYAQKLGLKPGIAVAPMQLDAPAALPAVGVRKEGQVMLTLGTSTGLLLCAKEKKPVEGICSLSLDGTLPGYYGYSAGQYGAGDILDWYMNNCLPEAYGKQARDAGISAFDLLTQKASQLRPLESGLVALDWWNGNRSRLVNTNLSGMILGMTLQTKPEEIFRALIEAFAMGTRQIFDAYSEHDIAIDDVYACGGMARKNPLVMQIYADVLGIPIYIAKVDATPAVGAAIFAATAAGLYESVDLAIEKMNCLSDVCYKPDSKNHELYNKLYQEYCLLHDYFGRGENNVMLRLKEAKNEQQP